MNDLEKPIRVLHFYKTCHPYSFGGVEQVIHQLCSGGSEIGIINEVLVLNPDVKDESIDINGYKVHCVKQDFQIASTGFSLSALIRFKELVKDADIVNYHFPWPFMDLLHFLIKVDKPTVVTYHSDIIRQKWLLLLYRPLQYLFLSNVDSIVTASPNYLASSEVLTHHKNKVEIIPFGLDKSCYLEPQEDLLEHWRSRVGTKFFLFLGVLRYYKGLHVLLEALVGSQYPVVIAGSGPIENELRERTHQLGLKHVYFCSEVTEEDKVALFTLCYSVVFPSHLRSEAFGISLLEGAMFGKPLISSEIGTGTTYINIDTETGIVIPPEDSTALRNAMKFLWENSKVAEKMGKCAYSRYQELFTQKKMVEGYKSLYKKLLRPPL